VSSAEVVRRIFSLFLTLLFTKLPPDSLDFSLHEESGRGRSALRKAVFQRSPPVAWPAVGPDCLFYTTYTWFRIYAAGAFVALSPDRFFSDFPLEQPMVTSKSNALLLTFLEQLDRTYFFFSDNSLVGSNSRRHRRSGEHGAPGDHYFLVHPSTPFDFLSLFFSISSRFSHEVQ